MKIPLYLKSFLCRCTFTKNQKHRPQPWRELCSTTAAALPPPSSLPPPIDTKTPPAHDPAIALPASLLLQPSVLASSTNDGEADSPSSSSFGCLPPTLLAPPHSSPRSKLAISSRRGKEKVIILLGLLAITRETHLVILEGEGASVPRRSLLLELRGSLQCSPP